MISFAPAKINLGLHITGKRPDGYHLLESLFVPIPLCDILEISSAPEAEEDKLHVLGDIDTGALADNLVLRAVRALRSYKPFPPVEITLKKLIPSGAGLGGGSSDASCTLKALRQIYSLDISDEDLQTIALSLGADCPFFIRAEMVLVQGIGEVFSVAPQLDLSGYHLVLVKPNIHIQTAEAFRALGQLGRHERGIRELIEQPMEQWKTSLFNDFERSLFPRYPELERIKGQLYDLGAVYASMSGSGATIYALFDRRLSVQECSLFASSFFWQTKLP